MAPFTAPLPFDEDMLFILHDVLKIDTTDETLHELHFEIPDALIAFGVVNWKDFLCINIDDIPTFSRITRGNAHVLLTRTGVHGIHSFLHLVTKRQNDNDSDYGNTKSYTATIMLLVARCKTIANFQY